MTPVQPVRGTQSLLGEDADRLARVVEAFNTVRRLYGFKRVEVPTLEHTEVFSRAIGETTDVVGKEMYSFETRGEKSVTLRPEFTAGICRAYLTEGWQQYSPLKLATYGSAFRYENPQKGRYREFHQLDAEIIGAAEPQADVELLSFGYQLLQLLGIADGVTLELNTLGDPETREVWRTSLIDYFEGHRAYLSKESKDRLQRNPLRILDSKDERDKAICANAPSVDDCLTAAAAEFFRAVTSGLDAVGVPWKRNPRLVRGLDYYRHTAFEFVTKRLGAQGTVIAGGRYDGLIEALGGPHTPAVGWAAGIERLSDLLRATEGEKSEIALIPRGEGAEKLASEVLALLRAGGVAAEMAFRGSPKTRFEKAKKALIPRLLDVELAEGEVGSVLIRDINVGVEGAEPVRTRLKRALEVRFELSDPEPEFPRPIHLIRRK